MMAAKCKRSAAGKPPEEHKASKRNEKKKLNEANSEESSIAQENIPELPYVEVSELPKIVRTYSPDEEVGDKNRRPRHADTGYKNRAPLQADERAKELLRSTLQHPINLTVEDLLNVSEPVRQELKKLLTKKRVEKKTVTFATEANEKSEYFPEAEKVVTRDDLMIDRLPSVTYEIIDEDRSDLKKGSIVIGDPVLQYLATLQPGEKPKNIVVARESQGLRAVYPLINNVGEVESLLDPGSQIVSIAKSVAKELEIPWDPDITIEMESANRSVERTLGLARNVPFLFGCITVYVQVHVMANPAYKVLGRPFDVITESLVKNDKDGSQSLTLTDPNTGIRCVMHTHERGKIPTVMKKATKQDFQLSLMN